MTWQPAAILPVDAELWAVAYFEAALTDRSEPFTDDVHVSDAVPDPREDRMVIVRRDGGLGTPIFDHPRLTLDVWGPDDEQVNDLMRMVIALARAAPNGNPVTHAEKVGGPIAIPDPSKQPRRQVVFEFHTRGGVLT